MGIGGIVFIAAGLTGFSVLVPLVRRMKQDDTSTLVEAM